jgi:ABC-type multidrug transport system ATPase subunit
MVPEMPQRPAGAKTSAEPERRPRRRRRPRPILRAREATKTYGDLVALAPLDLAIAPGERVALVGHNGSGKSTLLRLAGGLLQLTDGTIEIAGEPVGSSAARAAVSFLPDEPVLYDDLSVREHMAYIAALHGVDAEPGVFDDLLGRIGLLPRADDLPARFSRGLRQKTSVLLGLVRPFAVLLVDEPFVGLDPSGQRTLVELVEGAVAAGAAVLLATHQLTFLDRASRCIALSDGRIAYSGPVDRAVIGDLLE